MIVTIKFEDASKAFIYRVCRTSVISWTCSSLYIYTYIAYVYIYIFYSLHISFCIFQWATFFVALLFTYKLLYLLISNVLRRLQWDINVQFKCVLFKRRIRICVCMQTMCYARYRIYLALYHHVVVLDLIL